MPAKPKLLWLLALVLLIQAALIGGLAPPASAARVDVGLFYEPLAAHGTWVDYGNYGPCWYPSGVGADWRPYLNGRWVPTEAGWVFETGEPWGWACYHYGNWMPTADYGWMWCPGSTWYPSTVAWRHSDQYYGWAPIPPPAYGAALAAPLWVFAEAASFLLGFERPYAPNYSYYNCGCLAPVTVVPTLFPRTVLLADYYAPAFAPRAYYAFGPRFEQVSRVTNINVVQINNYVKTVNIVNVQSAVPPQAVLQRQPALRQTVPAPVLQGQKFKVTKASVGVSQLNRPNALPPPKDIPAVKAEIPKAPAKPAKPLAPGAPAKGLGLPQQAVRPVPAAPEEKPKAPAAKPVVPAPKPPAEVKPAPPRPAAPAKPEVRPVPREERKGPPPGEVRPAPREAVPPAAPKEVRPAPPRKEEVKPPPRPAAPPKPEVRPVPREEMRRPTREAPPAPAPREVRPAPQPVRPPAASAPAPREMRPAPAPAPQVAPPPAPKPAAPKAEPNGEPKGEPKPQPQPGPGPGPGPKEEKK